jgi:O-antigen/teichoic acid export membrane protein
MVFFMIVARRFGPVGLGKLTVLLMIGSAVGLFVADMGINTNIISKMSAVETAVQQSIASEALRWKIIMGSVSFSLMTLIMYATGSSRSMIEILAVGVISLGGVAVEFLAALMNGINRFDSEAWLRIVYRGCVFGSACLIAFAASLSAALLYMAVLSVVVVGTAFLLFSRFLLHLNLEFSFPGWLLLRQSCPVWVTQLAQMTYLKFDVVILGLLHVAALQIGWYAAAWKIVDVLTAIPAILAISALPLLNMRSPSSSAPQYLKIVYVLPYLFVLPIAIAAPWIMTSLYGRSFIEGTKILQILVWALVPIFVHTFLAVLALATHRQVVAAKLAATASGLGLVAGIIMVPLFGYEVMAVICLVANSLFASAMIFEFRHSTNAGEYATGLKSLVSALAIFAICRILSDHMHPVILALGGTCAYATAAWMWGIVSPAQLRRLLPVKFLNVDRVPREVRL